MSGMTQRSAPAPLLDRIAVGLSGLCAVHCVATAIVIGLLASAGGLLGNPLIHETGLSLAMVIGAIALGRGIREHGLMLPSAIGVAGLGTMAFGMTLHESGFEPVITIVGVSILAIGHRMNIKALGHAHAR
jgi:MerC mercury resistance protein